MNKIIKRLFEEVWGLIAVGFMFFIFFEHENDFTLIGIIIWALSINYITFSRLPKWLYNREDKS